MCVIIFARHGEADWNAEHRWQGQADRPLTEQGRRQAHDLATSLADARLDAAYSSDLSRAYDTAVIALGDRDLAVTRRAGLRERAFGAWDGLLDAEIPVRFPREYQRWLDGESAGAADAETFELLAERVHREVAAIAAAHRGGTVLIVAHSGPLAVVEAAAMGLDFLTQRRSLPEIPNGGRLTVSVEEGSWEVADLGSSPSH